MARQTAEHRAKQREYRPEQEAPWNSPQEQRFPREPAGVGKQQREILSPAFAELAIVSIHAGADGVSGITEANLAPRPFHGAREGYVFKDLLSEGGVSPDGLVRVALD